jgi:hypothetical protein
VQSQLPVDQLIRELVDTGRAATDEEVVRIIDRMASVPFKLEVGPVRRRDRGASHQGQTLGARADALTYHLIKRVAIERQWGQATTANEYLADLRRAIQLSDARLGVFFRRGGYIAATITPTNLVLPLARRGPRLLPNLLVIYSADRGIILSGYQFSTLEQTGIPEEVRWLR